jgi:hypothetical protein
MKKMIAICLGLTMAAALSFAGSVQSDIQSLKAELALTTDMTQVELIKMKLEALYNEEFPPDRGEGSALDCPPNDNCANAISVAVPSITIGHTTGTTFDNVPACGEYNSNHKGCWYTIIGTGHEITARTCDNYTNYDTQIAIYTGPCGQFVCVEGNDDFCNLKSSVTFCSEIGVVYYVYIHGYQNETGNFKLHIEDSGYPCGCIAPEVSNLTLYGELPFCSCINVCADQPMTICVGPLTANEKPSRYSLTPGCAADPDRTPESGCDEPGCTPVTPVEISDWSYDIEGQRWCTVVVSEEDGCFCFCLDEKLPVELTAFTAIAGDGEITLNWSTASETDNAYFDILREGAMVGRINAANSPTGSSYRWGEDNLINGREYSYTLASVSLSGLREEIAIASAVPSFTSATITEYALHQNFPNPFNPETSISFDLVESGFASLIVTNALGQTVATLVNSNMPAGNHTVAFEASQLPSGLYFYRLEAGDFSAVKKMVLMK